MPAGVLVGAGIFAQFWDGRAKKRKKKGKHTLLHRFFVGKRAEMFGVARVDEDKDGDGLIFVKREKKKKGVL